MANSIGVCGAVRNRDVKSAGCGSIVRNASLADTEGFDLLGRELGHDVDLAIGAAVAGGAVFQNASSEPLSVFRAALKASISDIETHPPGRLFQDFLRKGPYEGEGEAPPELREQRLSDEDTTSAIAFIYAHMVNCFKGAITELLATAPCLAVLRQLQQDGDLPDDARLYVGDAVWTRRLRGAGLAKGADFHILIEDRTVGTPSSITLAGVGEVKSYSTSEGHLTGQLEKHVCRAGKGMRVNGVDYPAERISVGFGKDRRVARIAVLPDDWELPRTFHFEPSDHGRTLHVDSGACPPGRDRIVRMGDDEWWITLRWSKEALAAAAYDMTFWYMEKVGEVIYSDGVPKDWMEMSPAEAGRNAVKMMLYYAILRCRTARENQRAIALYNSYCFGYALGMHFKNAEGRREMLWPEDLDEILAVGRTKHGCRIVR